MGVVEGCWALAVIITGECGSGTDDGRRCKASRGQEQCHGIECMVKACMHSCMCGMGCDVSFLG